MKKVIAILSVCSLLYGCSLETHQNIDDWVWETSATIGRSEIDYKESFGNGTAIPVSGKAGIHLSNKHAGRGGIECGETVWIEFYYGEHWTAIYTSANPLIQMKVLSIGKYTGNTIAVSGAGIEEPTYAKLWKQSVRPPMPKVCTKGYWDKKK